MAGPLHLSWPAPYSPKSTRQILIPHTPPRIMKRTASPTVYLVILGGVWGAQKFGVLLG